MKRKFFVVAAVAVMFALCFSLAACGGGGKSSGKFEFEQATLAMDKGAEAQLTVNTNMSGKIKFTSDRTQIVRASNVDDKTVKLMAVGEGTANITASLEGKEAKITVTVTEVSIVLETGMVSTFPGGMDEVSVTFKNFVSTNPQVTCDDPKVTVSVPSCDGAGATIRFTVANDAELGSRAVIDIDADGRTSKIELDVCSKGIVYGDGTLDGDASYVSSESGLLATGVNDLFPGGALVFPRYAKYMGYWAHLEHIGNPAGAGLTNPGFDITAMGSDKTITSVDTGDGASTVQHYAFANINTIAKVRMGESISALGDCAFFSDSFKINANAATPEEQITFEGTVEELVFDENCKLSTIGSQTFYGNKLGKLILPDTVSVIAGQAFCNTGIEVLKLPANWNTRRFNASTTFQGQFINTFRLKELYINWQQFFSVTGNHYPGMWHESWPTGDYTKEQISQILSADNTRMEELKAPNYCNASDVLDDKLFFENESGKFLNNIKVHYIAGNLSVEDATQCLKDLLQLHNRIDRLVPGLADFSFINSSIYRLFIENSNLMDMFGAEGDKCFTQEQLDGKPAEPTVVWDIVQSYTEAE